MSRFILAALGVFGALTVIGISAGLFLNTTGLGIFFLVWLFVFIKIRRGYYYGDFGQIDKDVHTVLSIALLIIVFAVALMVRVEPVKNLSELGKILFR